MPFLGIAAIFVLLKGLGNASIGEQKQQEEQLEEAIKRAVVSCYAIEGEYPDTLEYLENRYGVLIDHEKYDVFYEIFADNICPEITVVAK